MHGNKIKFRYSVNF